MHELVEELFDHLFAAGWKKVRIAEALGATSWGLTLWTRGRSLPRVSSMQRLGGLIGLELRWCKGRNVVDSDPDDVAVFAFGQLLEAGWTVSEIAESIGVEPKHVSRWHLGQKVPVLTTLIEVGELVGLELCWCEGGD
ncbi:MAG: hypothetical protein KTR15_05270 [Phycisphaeraceae bacterium]|nr:hypothetical protein [Phycisphaeraceae bacterium]